MRELWKTILHALEDHSPVCLVSLLSSSGSTPRGAGAMMAVLPSGASCGTIGGGNVEFTAQKLALEVLQSGIDIVREYRFVPGGEQSLGMVCGGDVTVQFQFIPAGDSTALHIFRTLLEADGQGQDAWLVRKLENGCVTAAGVGTETGFQFLSDNPPSGLLLEKPVLTGGNPAWFSIPAVKAGWVHIFGAGHVSRALAAVLHPLGFRCAVYDDRSEFADPSFFPTAARVQLCSYENLNVPISESDYVVVMTRGHLADYEVLCQTLRCKKRYIGCIGSRKKLDVCRRRLLDAGYTSKEYDTLHAPIGLSIGAQTPEEIAVSIAAELISVRAGVFSNA